MYSMHPQLRLCMYVLVKWVNIQAIFNVTLPQAQVQCKNLGNGKGVLASIHSAEENQFVGRKKV